MTDERKDIFIETVENLFNAYPMNVPAEALDFFEDYKKGKTSNRKEITDKGIAIILALRENPECEDWITAKALGEIMDVSGRSISGSMKKLVEDGYVEKRAGNPSAYRITEKGLAFEVPTAQVDNE